MFRLSAVFSPIVFLHCSIAFAQERITPDSLLVCNEDVVFMGMYSDVQVFQYLGTDSSSGKITYGEQHDTNGRVIALRYSGYKENSGTGFSDVVTIKEYYDNGLTRSATDYYQDADHKIRKTFYYYQDSLLIQMEVYTYEHRLKANSDKGYTRPGGCIVTASDYESQRSWKLENLVKYDYKNGKQFTSYSTITNTSQNGWEYTYDEGGRILTAQSMDGSRIVYTKYYSYSSDTIRTHLVWSNPDWTGTDETMIYDHTTGKLTEQWTTQGKNTWKKKYWYDKSGRTLRYVYYNSNGTANLTQVYSYRVK